MVRGTGSSMVRSTGSRGRSKVRRARASVTATARGGGGDVFCIVGVRDRVPQHGIIFVHVGWRHVASLP